MTHSANIVRLREPTGSPDGHTVNTRGSGTVEMRRLQHFWLTYTVRMQSPTERNQLSENIEAVQSFYLSEEQKISRSQRMLERTGHLTGQPAFLAFILIFVALWISANLLLRHFGAAQFDPPPFSWLQGMVGLGALLTATVVLIKQNRIAKLAEQRAHLDLKLTLLTEQKTAKLIDLLEELRRDLPNVRDRHDPEAASLQQSMNPDLVRAALDEGALKANSKAAAESKEARKEEP